MIKIIRIIARLNIGGPAIHTILLTEGLNKEKFKSMLVTGIVNSNEGDMTYLAYEKGVTPIFINELGREISWKDDIIALWKIILILKKENPDLVHTHTAKAGTLGRISAVLYNLFLTKFSSRNRIKLIHTFHGHVFHGYFGWLKTKIFILIEKVLAWFTDRIIAISSEQATDISNKYCIAPQNKISIISLGLDLNKHLHSDVNGNKFREDWKLSNKAILIGIIGRLAPIKNHKMFLDSIKIINTNYHALDSRFVVIGDGELQENLYHYVVKLGVKEDVIFAGWQKYLKGIYAALDIVALTSFNEGTPVSLIESMASGKAVVATRVGGVVDLMGKHQKRLDSDNAIDIFDNGILVNSNDVAAFAEALHFLSNDKILRDKMGANGREYVKERFQFDRLARDMERLYESL